MRLLKVSALLLACSCGALALSQARAEDSAPKGPQARIEHMCADQGKGDKMAEHQAKRAEHISKHLHLTDAQLAAFKDLQALRAKAFADAKTAICASKPDLSTFEKRLDFKESMLQRRLDGVKAERPKLVAFYNSLDNTQKAIFDEMRGQWGHRWGGHGDEGHEHGHHEHDQDRDHEEN